MTVDKHLKLRRSLLAAVAVPLTLAGIAACGSSSSTSGPSALDPATMAPADAVVYASITVRPQGSEQQALAHVINDLGGARTVNRILPMVNKALGAGINYQRDLEPWLGQRVGIVVTGLPSDLASSQASLKPYVAFIAPTSDPAAARTELAKLLKQGKNHDATGKVVGNYLVAGGADAVQAVLATKSSDSLASTVAYRSSVAATGPNAVFSSLMRLKPLLAMLQSVKSSTSNAVLRELLMRDAKSISANSTEAVSLSVTNDQIALDAVSDGVQRDSESAPAVQTSALPSDSWLALSAGFSAAEAASMNLSLTQALTDRAANDGNPTGGAAAEQIMSGVILPALGPMAVSLSGDSVAALHAGFAIKPPTSRGADNLIRFLYSLAMSKFGTRVTGGPTGFTVTVSPISVLRVGRSGDQVVATYGYTSAAQFLHASSTLASNATFKQAAATLPSGASPNMYLNFDDIAWLSKLDSKASSQKVWQTLAKFSYLVSGSTSTQSFQHSRIVIGLH